jgi:adenine-specific DNA-methyltransferase
MANYNELSKEELLQILEKKDEEIARKYGIFWDAEKIPEKVVVDCEDNLPVLERVKDKSVKTDETTDNILIEGDNYHALTVLNYTHKEKIDVIYIDPPYNTGNKDFTYNDRYVDKEDGYRHSKWLNFMEKRLNLAKRLLTDKGVIFISIDDNEQAQLKLLCDWVFGEQNFVANLIWKKKSTSTNVKNVKISPQVEYILCYQKTQNGRIISRVKLKETRNYNFADDLGKYRLTIIEKKNSGDYRRETMTFDILGQSPRAGKRWQIGEAKARELEKQNRFINDKGIIKLKIYDFEDKDTESAQPSLLDDHGTTDTGGKSLAQIFGEVETFNNPKPVELIKHLVAISSQPTSTILDFMAGSGTTGQAVLELNKEDGGNRQFILCTNNELNGVGSKLVDEKRPENMSDDEFENWKQQFGICQRVTYPRLEKVINGYNKNGDGDFVEGLGGNLQYYKTDFVKRVNNRDQIRFNLVNKCTEMLCVKESIFEKYEEKTNYKIFISNDKKRFLCVYYNFTKFDLQEFAEATEKLNGGKSIYIFADGEDLDLSLFEGIKDCNFEPIPEPILETYRELIKLNITK